MSVSGPALSGGRRRVGGGGSQLCPQARRASGASKGEWQIEQRAAASRSRSSSGSSASSMVVQRFYEVIGGHKAAPISPPLRQVLQATSQFK